MFFPLSCVILSQLVLVAADVRILPSTDSQSDLAFDECSTPIHTVAPAHMDKLTSEGYARGYACRRSPFIPPSDLDAQPLRHSTIDHTPAVDACHSEY